MSRFLRAIYYSLLILICTPANSLSEEGSTDLSDQLLNSERIANRFGNYDIEVVSQNQDYRISNLYSEKNGVKTTRTIAVVDFLHPVDPQIADLHESVLNGQSLGATFKNNGWKVSKINVALETLSLGDKAIKIHDWMKLAGDNELAMHVYTLKLSKDSSATKNQEDGDRMTDQVDIDYAVIAELHHPDYLDLDSLKKIHGEPARFSNLTEVLTSSIRSTLLQFIHS